MAQLHVVLPLLLLLLHQPLLPPPLLLLQQPCCCCCCALCPKQLPTAHLRQAMMRPSAVGPKAHVFVHSFSASALHALAAGHRSNKVKHSTGSQQASHQLSEQCCTPA
jgi:hypothetical protein